jgi:ABC-2 type transport system ATP-binding protein
MKRRVEIARALVHDPDVLLLDEPTVGLDIQTRQRIWDYVLRLRRERNLTVLVTTHYIDEVEEADRICIIDGGRILADGSPASLKAEHGSELLRVVPRSGDDAAAIRAAFAGRIVKEDGGEIVLSSDTVFAEAFLAEWGGRIRALSQEVTSLGSVFIALTGREIRDRPADAREQTLAFGRQGGEHTR